MNEREVKTEPEEAEIRLPVDHHLHSRSRRHPVHSEERTMLHSKEVKTEPEEAEIRLPVNRHLHSSCSDPCSALGEALEPTEPKLEPKLDPDCVKTERDVSPGRPTDRTSHLRRTEKGGHPEYVTLRSQQNLLIKSEVKESSITGLKNDTADCFDDFLEDFIKQKTKEEAVKLNKTEDEVLRLSECEESRSRACRTLLCKRIKISNRDAKCSTKVTRTCSKPNTPPRTEENHSHTDSEHRLTKSPEGVDKNDETPRKKKHFCPHCGRGYVHKCHLGVHMKTHTGEKEYSCPECGLQFYHNDRLQEHLRVHSGKRPYACDKCDKSFSRSGNLKQHQRCHTGERPHRCPDCARAFKSVRDMRRHRMTHTGDKPYACADCGKGFLRPATLTKHMRIHTGERPFLCSECGKTFPYAFSYSMHLKTH